MYFHTLIKQIHFHWLHASSLNETKLSLLSTLFVTTAGSQWKRQKMTVSLDLNCKTNLQLLKLDGKSLIALFNDMFWHLLINDSFLRHGRRRVSHQYIPTGGKAVCTVAPQGTAVIRQASEARPTRCLSRCSEHRTRTQLVGYFLGCGDWLKMGAKYEHEFIFKCDTVYKPCLILQLQKLRGQWHKDVTPFWPFWEKVVYVSLSTWASRS